MPHERRHERFPFRNVILVVHPSGTPFEVQQIGDISDGGLGFHSEHAWDLDQSLKVVVQTDQTFEIGATVRWCQAAFNGYLVGLEFDSTPDEAMIESLREIEAILAMHQATSISL